MGLSEMGSAGKTIPLPKSGPFYRLFHFNPVFMFRLNHTTLLGGGWFPSRTPDRLCHSSRYLPVSGMKKEGCSRRAGMINFP